MDNSKLLFRRLVDRISIDESREEKESWVYLLLEKVCGLSRKDIMMEKSIPLNSDHALHLNEAIERLNSGEPLQYILGEALFYGRDFMVNNQVLIPRPETELLIEVVKNHVSELNGIIKILDIGTGSGCIPVTLALEINNAKVSAIDISDGALKVAEENATRLNAQVNFFRLDILREPLAEVFDVIVSNPPYIAKSEMEDMQRNVLDYEPHLALFVDDNDPLIFYKHIVMKAFNALNKNGMLAVEINQRFGKPVADLFEENNFQHVKILKDMDNKDRVVLGYR